MTRDKRRAITTSKRYPAAKPEPNSDTMRELWHRHWNEVQRQKRALKRRTAS